MGRPSDPKPRPKSPTRAYVLIGVLGFLLLITVIVAELPASLISRLLPARVVLADLSGTVWHGSAGHIALDGRDVGAAEWHLHPAALLGMTLDADLHWVKTGFVMDTEVKASRARISVQGLHGAGSLEDLADLGLAPGWRGDVRLTIVDLASDYGRILAATGEVQVAHIVSPQIAPGADLGGYALTLEPGAVDAAGNIDAALHDTGGPLELQARVHYSLAERTGLLSGTLRERAGAPPELHAQIENLAQLKPRDAQGRIPADLEFRL